MKNGIRLILIGTVTLALGWSAGISSAASASAPEIDIKLLPAEYVFVAGDRDKFESQHWTKGAYKGGLEDFSLHYEGEDGLLFTGEARAVVNENYEGEFSLTKKGVGFVNFEYQEFRKYYDRTGGAYYRFGQLFSLDADRDLSLDIGHFGVEAGLDLQNKTEISLFYEREFRHGAKSRLSWGEAQEGTITKNIVPSWQELEEQVDMFGIRLKKETKSGLVFKGEQKWQDIRIESSRYEVDKSTTGAAAANITVIQQLEPKTRIASTKLNVEKWFWNDKAFASSGYLFTHLNNRENADTRTYNNQFNPANGHNFFNQSAQLNMDRHALVLNTMLIPGSWGSISLKLKGEIDKKEGNSIFPEDTTNPPDNVINRTEFSHLDARNKRLGEALSIRYQALPRTALFSDLEFEQARYWIGEGRDSRPGQTAAATGDVFGRETETDRLKGTFSVGLQTSPWKKWNITSNVRHVRTNNDYDTGRETQQNSTAFFDTLNMTQDEWNNRITFKPAQRVQTSFRYKMYMNATASRIENEDAVQTDTNGNMFVYDITLTPSDKTFILISYSKDLFSVTTPAALYEGLKVPTFDSNYDMMLLGFNRTVSETFSWNATLSYLRAQNFVDFSDVGLPLGADFYRTNVTFGAKWRPTQEVLVEPKYEIYVYDPNSKYEIGSYRVQVLGLEISMPWG